LARFSGEPGFFISIFATLYVWPISIQASQAGHLRARRVFKSGPYRRIPTPDIINGLREGVLTRE